MSTSELSTDVADLTRMLASYLKQNDNSIVLIPGGTIKSIGSEVLKAAKIGESFLLFPNLPLEVRLKIFELAVEDRKVFISIQAMSPTDFGIYSTTYLPPVFRVCKEAFESLVSGPLYCRRFRQAGSQRSVWVSKHDRMEFSLLCLGSSPLFRLKNSPTAGMDICLIQSLYLVVRDLKTSIAWLETNLKDLPLLQRLTLNVSLQVSNNDFHDRLFIDFQEEIHNGDFRYQVFFVHQLTFLMTGMNALNCVFQSLRIAPHEERAALVDLWVALSRCLSEARRNNTKFPRLVECEVQKIPSRR